MPDECRSQPGMLRGVGVGLCELLRTHPLGNKMTKGKKKGRATGERERRPCS
jgi:hypothetical protein